MRVINKYFRIIKAVYFQRVVVFLSADADSRLTTGRKQGCRLRIVPLSLCPLCVT